MSVARCAASALLHALAVQLAEFALARGQPERPSQLKQPDQPRAIPRAKFHEGKYRSTHIGLFTQIRCYWLKTLLLNLYC